MGIDWMHVFETMIAFILTVFIYQSLDKTYYRIRNWIIDINWRKQKKKETREWCLMRLGQDKTTVAGPALDQDETVLVQEI